MMMMQDSKIKFATFEACLAHICDAGYTPYIIANVSHPDYRGMVSPVDENGNIVLNISGSAVGSFHMDEEGISFLYAEGGMKRGQAYVPMEALGSVYAQEDINIMQPFPYKKSVDTAPKVVDNKPIRTQHVSAKPTRQGWTPKLIKGGKK